MYRYGRTASRLALVLLISAVGAFGLPERAAGQTVVGHVASDDGRAIPGAIVHLQDTDGRTHASGLTGSQGRFVLRAPAAGRYRLAVEMIGYRTVLTAPFDLGEGETVQRAVEAVVEPVALEGITVGGARRCAPVRGAEGDLARLWDEARKGLMAVVLTEAAPYVMFRTAVIERDLDVRSGTVLAERVRPRRVLRGYPFRTPAAEIVMAQGFIQMAGDTTVYIAPDAHLLLSDPFLDEYCFHLTPGRESGEVGLSFRPVARSGPPAVAGTLWLDRTTAGLLSLEYRYVRGGGPTAAAAGGMLEFERLPNDAWIVRSWRIHAPRVVVADWRTTPEVASVRETIGRVVEVRGLGSGDPVRFARATAEVTGRPLTSDGAAPVRHGVIRLVGTTHVDTTAADGSFRFSAVEAGTYEVALEWPAAFEEAVLLGTVAVEPDRDQETTLRAPVTAAALAGCPEPTEATEPTAVIHGTVRERHTGTPLPGAVVRVVGGGLEREERADAGGAFRVCGLPGARYQVIATLREFAAPGSVVELDDGAVQRADLSLTLATAAGGRARLIGRVVDGETERPLSGVSVRLGAAGLLRITDTHGNFTFAAVPAGAARLEATLLGYEDASGSIDIEGGETLRLDIRMTTRPIELEPIVVVASSADHRVGRLADFRYRAERGWGRMILREEIERRGATQTALLVADRGMRISQVGPSAFSMQVMNSRTNCGPDVYIDGIPVYRGNSPGDSGAAINLVPPGDIEGIEVYVGPASTPGEFGGSSARCGVVAIWTRGAAGGGL